jgi:hypothetical protein
MATIIRVLDEDGGFTTIGTGNEGEAGGAGVTGVCSTGVPQYSQNFTPGLTSFPQEVQNTMYQPWEIFWDIFYETDPGVRKRILVMAYPVDQTGCTSRGCGE